MAASVLLPHQYRGLALHHGSPASIPQRLPVYSALPRRPSLPLRIGRDFAPFVKRDSISTRGPGAGCRRSASLQPRASLALPDLATTFFSTNNLVESIQGSAGTVESILILAVIVTVHEFGHFLAARVQGITVTQFSIGFGPELVGFVSDGVKYSLRLIPMGGFVGFPDDDPELGVPQDDPNLLKNRPIAQRALVISSGVIANILFAGTVLLAQVSTVGIAAADYLPGVKILTVSERSAAKDAGLLPGDLLVSIRDEELSPSSANVQRVVSIIQETGPQELNLKVERDGSVIDVTVVPEVGANQKAKIGVKLSSNYTVNNVKASSVGEAIRYASLEFGTLWGMVVEGLSKLVFDFQRNADDITGPVGIVAFGSEAAKESSGLFKFAAIININLAVVNMLPLPALDGGYLAFLAVEALRGGKKLPDDLEEDIMSSGLFIILMLGIFLIVKDTLHLAIR
eukprot:jgi/Mesvir1/18064/Mv09375-RA.1